MAGLSTNAPGLWGGFAGLLYGSTSLSTPPGFLADATPAWVPAGGVLAFEFDNGLGYNSRNLATTTPDSILTYTAPSPKLVHGSDGVLGYAPHNLLLQSQTFDNGSWTKASLTVTANAIAAPDGTTTAEKIVATNTGATTRAAYQSVTVVASTPYVSSFYAKASEYDKVLVCDLSGGRAGATFDLTAVSATSAGGVGYVSSSIVSVGNGWFRCVLIWTSSATNPAISVVGYPTGATTGAAGTSYAGDGVSGIYIWGAQLNLGASALTYIPTTTAAVYSLPRDYNPTTLAALGVLVEEARTNLLRHSEDMTNAVWDDATAGLITANTTVAPNGTTTGDTITAAAVGSQKRQVFTGVASTAYTGSWYMKAGTSAQSRFNIFDFTSSTTLANATITWTAGVPVISGVTGTVAATSVGNGWYRIVGTGTSGASATPSIGLGVYPDNLNGTGTIVVWGAQLE